MSDIQLYLLEYEKNKAEARKIAFNAAQKLESKQVKLIDLISSLEDPINNKEDSSVRARSVAFLADVLEHVPGKVLSGQERRLLTDFVLGRLESDVEGIGASSRALVALEALGKWDRETAQRIMRTYITYAHPLRQFKLLPERLSIIQLLDLLVAKYRDSIKHLHESDPDFLGIFISYFEGEKDPRNLMIIFSILHVPMTEWDVQGYAQELFEAVFNYFPITFTPPPDDPYGITAKDLKDRLRLCIAANSNFAPHSFPALLDKLDSASLNTKRDVLQTIQSCVVSYGSKTVSLYAVTLWDALKFEILNVQDEDLANEALEALSLIAKNLAADDSLINVYTRPIIKECNEHLEDAPTKQSQAAGTILHAVAASSPRVADKIALGVLPVIISLYQASESITKRRGLLEVLNQILKAYTDILKSPAESLNSEAISTASQEALEIMLHALISAPKAEVSFRLASLEGLILLVGIPNLLPQKDIYRAIDTVTDVVLHEQVHGHGDIQTEVVKALTKLSKHAPNEIRDRAIPAFMVQLPDDPKGDTNWEPTLEAFAQLSQEQQVFDTVVLRLKNKFQSARQNKAPKEYQQALLVALLYAFTHGSPGQEDGVIRRSHFLDFVAPLLADLQQASDSDYDFATLVTIGRLCNIVLRPQTLHFQASIYNENLQWISPAHNSSMNAARFASLTPFSLYYYAALQPQVAEPEDIASVLQLQAQSALAASDVRKDNGVLLQHISLLINKFFIATASMKEVLSAAGIEVQALLDQRSDTHAVEISFAVLRGLLTQGNRGAKSGALMAGYTDILLRKLSDDPDAFIARKFATLLAPDDILVKENHCLVSSLYKQKAFSLIVPALIDAVRSPDSAATKPNNLIALSGILRFLPYSMLESSLVSLIPPLLQTLDLSEPDDQIAKSSTLIIFEAMLLHNPDLLDKHVGSLVSRLLDCTSSRPDAASASANSNSINVNAQVINSAAVRAKSLLCLALVPKQLRRETILPYRRRVVQKLLMCLDDARRNVRGEAVRCRKAWLGLEEDEE